LDYNLAMKNSSLLILALSLSLNTISSASAIAADSGSIGPQKSVQTMYWSCTNTTLAQDPTPSGWWFADASGGDWGSSNRNVYCWNAGQNPPNSIPMGISIWLYTNKFGFPENKEYYLCAHIVPQCGWVAGPAPATPAPPS
jgi:hypothetical protein